MGSRLPGNSRR